MMLAVRRVVVFFLLVVPFVVAPGATGGCGEYPAAVSAGATCCVGADNKRCHYAVGWGRLFVRDLMVHTEEETETPTRLGACSGGDSD